MDFYDIYKFSGQKQKIIMIFGIILALISGVTFPLFVYVWGKEMDHTIRDADNLANTLDISLKYYIAFMGLAIASLLINALLFAIWNFLSETIAKLFRMNYL